MKQRSQFILLFFLLFYPLYSSADVSKLLLSGDACCWINIYGEIKNEDIVTLKQGIKQFKDNKEQYEKIYKLNSLTIRLMSLGGDVQTAITLGRILRSIKATVAIPSGSVCASACVLAYAGGVFRAQLGDVFIHRPYSTITGERSELDIIIERERIKSLIEEYLTDVNVSKNLYELMDSIPPKESRKLTDNELKLLKLDMLDPVFEEQIDAREAADLNLSRQEYYKKLGDCEEQPYKSNAWRKCMK